MAGEGKKILVEISIKKASPEDLRQVLGGTMNNFKSLILVSNGFPDKESSEDLLGTLGAYIAAEAGDVPEQVIFIRKK